MTTVAELMAEARRQFAGAGCDPDEAHRRANLLMQHLLETDAAGLIAREQDILSNDEKAVFGDLVKRAEREPVHRILGWREFHGLKLTVSPSTLEPRDDTETLIDAILLRLRDSSQAWRFADLGTGTGAVALALLSELPTATALATDIDPEALQVAQHNADVNGLSDRFSTSQGNWFDAVSEPFDFIVSNPPYIPSATIGELQPQVRDYDPMIALDGGADGLNAYRTIIAGAALFLEPGGFLALEIGHDQAGPVSALALAESFTTTSVRQDLAGRNRALLISR